MEEQEDLSPSVPTELLELHLELEEAGITAEEFGEVYGDAVRDES